MSSSYPPILRLRAFAALFCLVLLPGVLAAAAQSRLTPLPEDLFPELKDILRGALQQSPQMMLKNIELAQTEAARMTARAQMLPNLATSVSYNINDASVSSNTNESSRSSGLFYSAYLSQPVYRWGTLQAQTDAAKIQLSIKQRDYAEAYRFLAISIRNQYLGLVAKKLALHNALAARERTAYTLSLEEAKLQYGRISQSDIISPRMEMEEARLRADRAVEDLALARKYFARLTGLPEPTEESIPDQIPAIGYDPAVTASMAQSFLGQAWENHPAILSARDWVKVGELNYKTAKYRLYPMFYFAASISQSNSTNVLENSVRQTGILSKYVGLTASWSIFDGRATKAAQISARANTRYYERLLQTQTDTLLDQVRSMEKQLGFSYRAMLLSESRNTQAEAAAHQRQDEAKQGLASQVTVDIALAAQDTYRLYLLNQRLDLLSRWSEFVSTVETDPVLQLLPQNISSNAR